MNSTFSWCNRQLEFMSMKHILGMGDSGFVDIIQLWLLEMGKLVIGSPRGCRSRRVSSIVELVSRKVTSFIWGYYGFYPDAKGEPKDIT